MCISFNFVVANPINEEQREATREQSASTAIENLNQHETTSCDKTQVGFYKTQDGKLKEIVRVPIVSESAVLAMVTAPRELLGEEHEAIVPCESVPCLHSPLSGFMDPGEYVDPPKRIEAAPTYRGNFGNYRPLSASAPPAQQPVLPSVELEPGRCVKNPDGSKIFTLRTAEVALSDEELKEQIEAGKWKNKEQFLKAMHAAAWFEFNRACAKNGVDMTALFECTGEKDDNGFDVVAPEAVINFMHMFYPCLLSGSDIMVFVPPIKGGKAVMDTPFSVMLQYDEGKHPAALWLPSLQHNNPFVEHVYEQDEHYVIYAMGFEKPFSLQVGETNIPLYKMNELVPNEKHRKWVELDDHPSGFSRSSFVHPHYDYVEWLKICSMFQKKCYESIVDRLFDGGVIEKKEADPTSFYMTNLLGTMIPKNCNSATVCEYKPVDGSYHTHGLRERVAKRKRAASGEERAAKRRE